MTPGDLWDILIVYGDASAHDRLQFVTYLKEHQARHPFEFRFCGHFGFGGKLRIVEGKFKADYYPEDRTSDRDAWLKVLNEKLGEVSLAEIAPHLKEIA